MKTIFFDMDGTIADLYSVPNWLDKILLEDEAPYRVAEPMVDMKELKKICLQLKDKGYKIGIITWLSKNATKEYKNKVRKAKKEWLKKHFNLNFDYIHIVQYGYNKRQVNGTKGDILIDDEEKNIKQWELGDRIGINCKNKNHEIIHELNKLLVG